MEFIKPCLIKLIGQECLELKQQIKADVKNSVREEKICQAHMISHVKHNPGKF